MARPEQEDRQAAEGAKRRSKLGRAHPLLRCEILRGGPLQTHRRDHKETTRARETRRSVSGLLRESNSTTPFSSAITTEEMEFNCAVNEKLRRFTPAACES
ncbi:hypothetical protein K0M31_002139 [Melipona bicolor]|uniref:Uncharacterized protein n=1 Tax=Melipona bicolor TaxID=60889 RepID=A0AA40GGZ6_9HYME|nr:hypothetical protein K0M31_002139 [Melipona bicolor]